MKKERTGIRGIRINQAGYLPRAPKLAVVEAPPVEEFELRTIGEEVIWKTVLRKKLMRCDGRTIADFSEITAPGDYCVVCGERGGDYRENSGDGYESYYFVIRPEVYDPSARLMAEYFRWQRCGSELGWAGRCHQDPVPLVGTGRFLDMRGGYHQSCDLRCWSDGISLSLLGLLHFAEREHPPWDRGQLAEELRWGCEYFLKLIAPEGFLYDSQFVPIGWGPRDYYNVPTNLGAHCNTVLLLAGAARCFREFDPNFARRCEEGARKIHRFLEDPENFRTPYVPPVKNLPRGTQGEHFYFQSTRDSAGGLCGRIAAALALGAREIAFALVPQLLELLTPEGYFRQDAASAEAGFSDCSYGHAGTGDFVLFDLLEAGFDQPEKLVESVAACAAFQERLLAEAGWESIPRFFFDSSVGENRTQQGSGSVRALHSAIFWLRAARLLEKPKYREYAQRCFDWIFGANPEEASYITGVGYNQKRNPVFGQFFPSTPQIPGGIHHVMNGEYDMPSVGMALWAVALFKQEMGGCETGSSGALADDGGAGKCE